MGLEIYVMETMANLFQSDKAFGGKATVRRRIANDTQGYISEMLAKAVNQRALNQELNEEDRNRLLCLLKNFGDLGENDVHQVGQTKCKTVIPVAWIASLATSSARRVSSTRARRDGCEITVSPLRTRNKLALKELQFRVLALPLLPIV